MVSLQEDSFGLYVTKSGEKSIPVRKFVFKNQHKVEVEVITYGATITSIKYPNKNGQIEDIVMGYNTVADYRSLHNPYFGATVGRMANRIGSGQIKFRDNVFHLTRNLSETHQLHGGFVGFDKSVFGQTSDKNGKLQKVKLFTWINQHKISVQVINYGATIVSLKIAGKSGDVVDIVTGYNNIEGYQNPANRFFGATIGRVANRVKNGHISHKNVEGQLSKNRGGHHLHGGFQGFDKVLWEPFVNGNRLVLSYHSQDGEEGYPGDLVANVSFELTDDNRFLVDFKATTTKATFVNMTNHSYFNLAGHNKGPEELYKHTICINADSYTETDADSIPTGIVLPVAESIFDLQVPRTIGDIINRVPNMPGYDNNFCITKSEDQGVTFVARAVHPESGRVLEIYSDQPGVQFYTANFLPENPQTFTGDKKSLITITGKDGDYYKHGAFCLETQNWPDAPNHANFPNGVLYPGDTYKHTLIYKFSVKN